MCARKTFQAKCQAILHPIPLAPGTKSCPAHPCLPPKHSQFALDVSKLQEPQQVQPPGHVSTHHLMYPVSMHCVSGCIRHIYRPIGPSIDQPTLSMYLSIGRSIYIYTYTVHVWFIMYLHVFFCVYVRIWQMTHRGQEKKQSDPDCSTLAWCLSLAAIGSGALGDFSAMGLAFLVKCRAIMHHRPGNVTKTNHIKSWHAPLHVVSSPSNVAGL